jgi:hypothetical protein
MKENTCTWQKITKQRMKGMTRDRSLSVSSDAAGRMAFLQ